MNSNVLFVRVFGTLVPIKDVTLVQVSPNDRKKVVQEIPLSRPLEDLMEYNITSFVTTHVDRQQWDKELSGVKGTGVRRTERD